MISFGLRPVTMFKILRFRRGPLRTFLSDGKGDMKTRPEIPQEIFNELLDEAIKDLCKSGLSKKEIITIIESQFGLSYAQRFRENAPCE